MIKVLFVCADNLTRSVMADYCLQKYITEQKIKDIEVRSAGTLMNKYADLNTSHFDELKRMGMDPSPHQPTKLTQELTNWADIVIALDDRNQQFIFENFHKTAVLFNEVCFGQKTSLKIDWSRSKEDVDQQLRDMVHHVYQAMPNLINNLPRYI